MKPADVNPELTQVVEVNLGAGSDRLGGPCDRYRGDDLYLSDSYGSFCDGPLKAKTSYRYSYLCEDQRVPTRQVNGSSVCPG